MIPEVDIDAIGTLNEDWLSLEKSLGFRPGIDLRAVPIEEIRDNTAKGAAAMSLKFPPPVVAGLVSEDREIPTSDGATILVRIYKLDSLRGRTTPTVIFYHGGGFVLGDIDREDALCKSVIAEVPCTIVSVGYRHAPEFHYPIPVQDSYDAVLWTFDHLDQLGGDPNAVFTSGNSAGAALALVVTRRLRDSDRKERIAGQILRVPVACHPSVFPPELATKDSSYYKYHDAPILSTKSMDDFWYFYNPGKRAGELDCSPLLAEEFKEFPPTYISVAGCDPLRDQGIMLAKKMDAAGVNVKFEVMGGYPHGHNNWPQIKGWQIALDMFIGAHKWAIEEAKLKN